MMAEKTEESVSNTKKTVEVKSEVKMTEEQSKDATEEKSQTETNEQKQPIKPNPKGKENIPLSPSEPPKNPWKKISKDGMFFSLQIN